MITAEAIGPVAKVRRSWRACSLFVIATEAIAQAIAAHSYIEAGEEDFAYKLQP